ncbi:MAG TPA: hypothetical protein VMV43_08160 [Candidatus Nanopelagicaceae bacterium]|nr:hypothetical protein [Candidatus Nanopelagicaceae bacterium]
MDNKNLESLNLRINNLKKWLSEGINLSSSLKFLESLRIGLSLILPSHMLGNQNFQWNGEIFRKIKRDDLSLFLGQNKYHIKEAIKKAKYESNYFVALEFINKMESSILKNLSSLDIPKDIIYLFIDKILYSYIKKNSPPYSNRFKSKNFHPNLNKDYFTNINSIKKAYWLGLLWADGWISKKVRSANGNANYTVGLKQSEQHQNLIKDYCDAIGFNPLFLKKYLNNEYHTWYYQAQLMNNRFAIPLIKMGFIVGKKKSLNIEMPILRNTLKLGARELYLGFLLGYYDGDGTKGRTYITCGSIKLVNQIREKFNLSNKITKDLYLKKDGTQGKIYKFPLGRDLMCEMLNNYQNSFKPKRKAIGPMLKNSFEKLINIKKKDFKEGKISIVEIQKYIWKLGINLELSSKIINEKITNIID